MPITQAPNEIRTIDILRELGYTNPNIDISKKIDLDLRLNGSIIEVKVEGVFVPLNMCSTFLPDPNKPHELEHWYGYDHLEVGDCCGVYDPVTNSNFGKIPTGDRVIVNSDKSVTFYDLGNNPRIDPFKTPSINGMSINPAILSTEFNGFYEFPNTRYSSEPGLICNTSQTMTVYAESENILTNSLTKLYRKSGSSLVPLTGTTQYRYVRIGNYVYVVDFNSTGNVLIRDTTISCGNPATPEVNDIGLPTPFFGKDYQIVKVSFKSSITSVGEWFMFFVGKDSNNNQLTGSVQRTQALEAQYREFTFDMSNTPNWNNAIIENVYFLFLRSSMFDLSLKNFTICSKDGLKAFSGVRLGTEITIPEQWLRNSQFQGSVSITNTGNQNTSGTITIKVYFPSSNITYVATTTSGYTYSFASNILTITTTNVIQIGQIVNIPINMISSVEGIYTLYSKVYGGGDLVHTNEANGARSKDKQIQIFATLPCIPINSVQIQGQNIVDFDSLQTYNVFYSGGNYAPTILWSVVGGTIVGSNNGNQVSIRWNLNPATSGSVSVRLDNQCTTNLNTTLTVARRSYGNDYQVKTSVKNNCPVGQFGTAYTTEVQPNTYFAKTKQEANDLAIAFLDANSQTNANNFGTCIVGCNNITNVTISGSTTAGWQVSTVYTAIVTGGTGVKYEWSVTNGIVTSGQGTSSATVLFNFNASGASFSNAVVTVRAFQDCSSSERSTQLIVNPILFTASDTRTLVKNNCPINFEPALTKQYFGQVTSAISQQAANEALNILFATTLQDLANTELTCRPSVFFNVQLSQTYTRSCPVGYRPSQQSYTHIVPAGKYSGSTQTEANEKALNELANIDVNQYISCVFTGIVNATASIREINVFVGNPTASNFIRVEVSISNGLGFVSSVNMFDTSNNQLVASSSPSSNLILTHNGAVSGLTTPGLSVFKEYRVELSLFAGEVISVFASAVVINKDYSNGFAFIYGYQNRRNPIFGGPRRLLTIRILPPLYFFEQSLNTHLAFIRWRIGTSGAWNNFSQIPSNLIDIGSPNIEPAPILGLLGNAGNIVDIATTTTMAVPIGSNLYYFDLFFRQIVLKDEVLDSDLGIYQNINLEMRFLSQVSEKGSRLHYTALSPPFIYTLNYTDIDLG